MSRYRKLTRKQKVILSNSGLDPKEHLKVKQDYDSFTVVDIRTGRVLPAIRY